MKHKISFPLAIATNFVVGLSAIAPVAALQIKPIDSDPTGISNIFDEFQQFVQEELLSIDNPNALELDPTKLILAADHDVRLYFINEGAGYKNQLGFTATNGVNSQEALAFDNISCHIRNPECQLPSANGILNVGDYVELGNFAAGTQFDFWLLANGFNNPDPLYRYGANPALNPDGLEHLVAWEYKNYVVLGFEDLYGPLEATEAPNENSDRDFNDVVFVVDLPVVKKRSKVPEPASTVGLFALGIIGLSCRRKRHLS